LRLIAALGVIMTKDEFEEEYAKRSKVTIEWLHNHNLFGVPCDCGENGCMGWQMKRIITPNKQINPDRAKNTPGRLS